MTAAQFAERLASERASGAKSILKDLGVEKVEDAKTRLDADKKRTEAEMTESQRQAALVESLKPKAASADRFEAAIKAQLEAWEQAVPAEKKALLDLAPAATDPASRFEWFTKANKAALFAVAPSAPPTPPKPPANSRAGGPPPPPDPPGTQKHARDMTPAEFAEHQRKVFAELGKK